MTAVAQVVAKAEMLIRRPIAEVFEAFVDPAITARFWFSRGDARLEAGKRLLVTLLYGEDGTAQRALRQCSAEREVGQQLQVQADDRQRYRPGQPPGPGADRQRAHQAPVGNEL